ncbi:DUF4136 domain-containing protein [Granulicella sibirica]|uniref:Putative lipoprotein n=1 Tax=Granulicella sibirica TaxID=2479048 RepID=A0A4Q0SX33_9BACT|nr:DUF4136 domain-containing protein [Granulicella sibirica]RXH53999.1 putative lipoprotein [Granulicella sibirica]
MTSSLRSNVLTAIIAASLSTVMIASAAAQQVSTDYDHKANFQQYHTFSIFKLQASNPLVEQRLHDALVHDLTARGLTMVPQGGDLAITAIGSRKNQQEYNTFYEGLGGGGFGWRGRGFGGFGGGFGDEGVTNTQVINVPLGSLVVDVYDGSKHQLLFRGVANDTLSNKEEKNSKKLQKAVDKIFDKFPTKNAG